jgi:colanic acid/amylovoran biosynthesis protein
LSRKRGSENTVKILFTNCTSTHLQACEDNKGSAGHVIGTIEMLRMFVNSAEFTTFVQFSEEFADKHGIKVFKNRLFRVKIFSLGTILKSWSDLARCILWRLWYRHLPSFAKVMVNTRELREYARADLIVDLSMDTYSDDFGLVSVVEHCKDILLGILLKKPVVIWAQSLGPFKSKLTSWLVRLTLNKVALITVREEISLGHLRKLRVNVPPIHVTADPAFILLAASEQRAKDILTSEGIDIRNRPLIGMAMTWTTLMAEANRARYLKIMESAYWLFRILFPETLFESIMRLASHFKRLNILTYVKLDVMNEIVEYLVEKLSATVVLIPHDKEPRSDDTLLAQEILQRAKHERVRLISGDYSAPELKAVIGQCDLFIGAKMHANIAAISMNVPTVAVQYSHKFHGIMGLLGQEKYICDTFTIEEVKSKIDKAWSDKGIIRAELGEKIDIVKKHALDNARLVAALLGGNRVSSVS